MKLGESEWSKRHRGAPPIIHRPLMDRVREALNKVVTQTREDNKLKEPTSKERKERAEELRRAADALERGT